jgi:hypothetical protein
MSRYLRIPMDMEFVARWEIGLDILVVAIRRKMRTFGLREWPTLRHAEKTVNGATFIFGWDE